MEHLTRKIIISATVCLAVCVSAAGQYFSTDFDADSENPLDGWRCHGAGKEAKDVVLATSFGSLSSLFPAGCDAYQVLSFPGVADAAYSNSTTVEGGKVDEWLVSPVITVPEDKESVLLRYDEIAIGSIRPGNYDVYLSESGTEPADFTTHLYAGRPKGSSTGAVAATVCVPLKGFGGKDIRIAFVNSSSGTCLLGFTGISLIDYSADATSRIPEFTSEEGVTDASFNVSVTTPAECKGFVARLYVTGEDVRQYTSDFDLSQHFEDVITFEPGLRLTHGQKKDYTLEITPADTSLPPYILEGSVTCAEGFPGVCVMEEATGSWCPACVRGAAALARYSDEYPGQFFGIAVHENDPMTVQEYNTALKQESRITSFPSGWFNRTVRDDPQKINHVKKFVSEKLASKVTVDKVYHYIKDGKDKLTVLYSPQLCYDTDGADFRAVAVITEDHCKGVSPSWSQKNGYSDSSVEKVGGEDWWPYFEFFSSKGGTIPAAEMEYNHVAWGIYNDYDGTGSNISASWQAYTPQQYSITFDVPLQTKPDWAGVQNINNTAVTVILLDGKTGQVAGAGRLEAADYIEADSAGITETSISDISVSRDSEGIRVCGEGHFYVEIFDITGRCLGRSVPTDGCCMLRAEHNHRPVIVRVTSGRDTQIFKVY